MSFSHLFVLSFNNCLLRISCVPVIIPGTDDAVVNKRSAFTASLQSNKRQRRVMQTGHFETMKCVLQQQ